MFILAHYGVELSKDFDVIQTNNSLSTDSIEIFPRYVRDLPDNYLRFVLYVHEILMN